MRKLTLATIAAALMTMPAYAADLSMPVKAPPVVEPAPAFSWTGFYLGANAGYGWGSAKFNSGVDLDGMDGGLVGGQIGYNLQYGQVVFGVETDLQYADMKDRFTFASGSSVSSELRYFGTVRARVGYAFDRILPYVTGGFAYGSNKVNLDYSTPVSEKNTQTGYTIGAGVEYAFTSNLSAKVEYLWTDLGDDTYAGRKVDVDFNTVRAGINYRF
ncbi:porin family protein [Ancylobacter sp. 6x-1]|uniref:Porin family protein n=1 Tax=Ancylobacter crimeensis TaxID=2579147 RepID=A0ABT0DAS9_9HYPH|nr:outer membrane protein [Ancylobacter crimeensis]MCK0197066.1 porin family protein [Ancylobacter crimeensis]